MALAIPKDIWSELICSWLGWQDIARLRCCCKHLYNIIPDPAESLKLFRIHYQFDSIWASRNSYVYAECTEDAFKWYLLCDPYFPIKIAVCQFYGFKFGFAPTFRDCPVTATYERLIRKQIQSLNKTEILELFNSKHLKNVDITILHILPEYLIAPKI